MPKLLIVDEIGYLLFAGAGQPVLPGRGAAQGLTVRSRSQRHHPGSPSHQMIHLASIQPVLMH
jgi:hypothetical protein